MSIVPLEHVTFVGLSSEKDRLLDDLHTRGCLELIPLGTATKDSASGGPSSEAREALKFLLSCPQRRRQVRDAAKFDAESVERQALDLQKSIQALESERDFLLQRIADAKPWGDFRFPSLQEMGELRLWFYVVPHKDMPKVEATGLAWEVVRRDPRFCYVVVLEKTEPQSMPVPRVHLGARSSGGPQAAPRRGGTGHRGRPGGTGASDAMVPPFRASLGPTGGCRRPCQRGAADVRPRSAVRLRGLGAAGAVFGSWRSTRHETGSYSKAGRRLPMSARQR